MPSYILEVSEEGVLRLPPELIHQIKLYSRYRLEIQDDTLILYPQSDQPLWTVSSPEQRAAQLRQWANGIERPSAPPLSDDALKRDAMYD
jgi:hypothetical protein